MKELDDLFIDWKKNHKDKGYERFIVDGIVDEDWWWQTKEQRNNVPRICFFLKEARSDKENYNLVNDLKENYPWMLWQKVSIWTQAIQNALLDEKSYDDQEINDRLYDTIKQIAVVNVKKSNGTPTSDNDDLWNFVKDDKDLLRQQIELIKPDIIVCGYTFSMLCHVLDNEVYKDGVKDKMYAFWNDKLIIDYYHPACHYPNRVNYYALMSICKMALKELEIGRLLGNDRL